MGRSKRGRAINLIAVVHGGDYSVAQYPHLSVMGFLTSGRDADSKNEDDSRYHIHLQPERAPSSLWPARASFPPRLDRTVDSHNITKILWHSKPDRTGSQFGAMGPLPSYFLD